MVEEDVLSFLLTFFDHAETIYSFLIKLVDSLLSASVIFFRNL